MSAPNFNAQFLMGCLQIYPFHHPFPKAAAQFADFRNSFRTYMATSNDTKMLIDNLMSARLAFLQISVPGSLVPPHGQITAVKQYLTLLYTLHESLLAAVTAEQAIVCDKELVFEWSMYLSDKAEHKEFRSGSLLFEIIMTTQLKALLHIQVARELLNNDVLIFCSEAGKQLLQASSLFDMLSSRLADDNKWGRRFHPKLANPLETSSLVMSGLSLYLKGRAQSCAAIKAMYERKASALLIARLFTGGVNLHASALSALALVNSNSTSNLRVSLIAAIGCDRELLSAVSLYHLAMACVDSSKGGGDPQLGQALTCVNMARAHLSEQQQRSSSATYDPSRTGLPKSTSSAAFSSAIKQLLDIMTMQSIDWDRDNRLIYFQGLPSSIEEFTIPMPSEAIVANLPVPSEPDPSDIMPVVFIDPPKARGVFGAMMSVFRSPSSSQQSSSQATAAADGSNNITVAIEGGQEAGDTSSSGSAGQGMTDEQFAKELQRRMNLANSTSSST